MADTFGLHDAAKRLGVHYQTAYQWVRRGDLPAVQVGRQYVINADDLDTFAHDRAQGQQPRPRRPRAGFSSTLPRFHRALVEGDEGTARDITNGYVATGTPLTDVIVGLFGPALRQIGEAWSTGDVSIAVEHRATAIVTRLLATHTTRARGRPRGSAVVATPPGDFHDLAALMAAAALREAGWKVHHLGANLPADEAATFAEDHDVDLVVYTATSDESHAEAAAAIDHLAARSIAGLTNEPGMSAHDLVAAAEATRGR